MGLEHQGGYAGRGRGGFVPRGRGRGGFTNTWTRGGGSGGANVSHHRTFRIDNRTAKLSIHNIDESSKDGLKEHFEAFGEIESFNLEADGISATVQYKTRKDAEAAMQQGSQMPNAASPLKLGWISEPVTSIPAMSKTFTPTTTVPAGATASSTEATAASAVAYQNDSDDEDDGERSWKR
ncbi:hypothetical protein BG011_008193 [Mortierella polycephala]|uniref:RRM domain-containing protein n=1 Tax=Mortierella polycephala TaxID=41804 RepID=A0A9P6TWV2_9FUNG|nr:hypothetical protein BG011_008193 [Mortierella polycephala]